MLNGTEFVLVQNLLQIHQTVHIRAHLRLYAVVALVGFDLAKGDASFKRIPAVVLVAVIDLRLALQVGLVHP